MKSRWILGVVAGLSFAAAVSAQNASPTPTEIKKVGEAAGEAATDAGKAVGGEAKKVGDATATGAKDAEKAVDGEAKKVGEDFSDELRKIEGKDTEPKPTPRP